MERQHSPTDTLSSAAGLGRLVDALPQLVWLEQPGTRCLIYANAAFERYFLGADGAHAWASGEDPRRLAKIEATIGALRAAVDPKSGTREVQLRSHDGRVAWHQVSFRRLVEEDGALGEPRDSASGWLGSATDIDAAVAERKAVEETGRLLRLAQGAAGAGLFDLDLGSKEVILSPDSAGLHGLPADRPAIVGFADWLRQIHPDDRAPALRGIRAAIAARRTFDAAFRVRLADGSLRWIQAIGRPGAAGRITGLNLDISARKAAEAALIEAKSAAEVARLSAEQADRAKTEFLSAMSHEIRTPLNAVIGFSGLLAGSKRLDPDLQRYADLVRASSTNLLSIVNDILDFSSVEAGAVSLRPQAFAVDALVEGCLAIVSASASAKALDTACVIDADLPRLLVGDEARLRQVLLNLLNNAVKFTSRGSVTVSVRREGLTPWGERVRFSVSDTGIGIPEDKQGRLFERFYQVDASIRRDHGGTGLGLAISKRLVACMGGEIGVASRAGHGSTFWFVLSLPRGHGEPAVAPQVESRPKRTARVLLVEDIDINRELACLMLRRAGHAVDIAENGFAAVRAVEANGYDLVLMDIQMPGMDGLMATRLIRCLPAVSARVPIVAMTANVLPEQVRAFREAGLDDHLGKPFSSADLEAVIARWLPGGEAAREDAATPEETLPSAVDRNHYERGLALLPPGTVARLLDRLGRLAAGSFRSESTTRDERDQLRAEAHALAGVAGLIGFLPLGQACASLEGWGEARIEQDGRAGFDDALSRAAVLATAASREAAHLISNIPGAAPGAADAA